MRTNLLKITKLPSVINTVESSLTYREVIQFLKSKPIYFHLLKKKLYFIGDPELVNVTLENEDIGTETNKIEVDSAFILNNWDVVCVLLYKIFRHFLIKRGFSFHSKFKNRAFMVNEIRHRTVTFIYNYSNSSGPAFVHEGFNFFFRLFGEDVFLGINPCVIVTRDGMNCIRAKDLSHIKYREYKTWFIDRRYNSVVRKMFNAFVDFLCNENKKVVIFLFDNQVEIDGRAIEIDWYFE